MVGLRRGIARGERRRTGTRKRRDRFALLERSGALDFARLTDSGFGLCRFGARAVSSFRSFAPAAENHPPFGRADVFGKFAVAFGGLCLPTECVRAGFHVAQDFVEPRQVGFRRAEFLFGVFAPHVQPGNPSRFFEHRAAVHRLGCDDGADLALTNKSGRMGAGSSVSKEQANILGADIPAIDPVSRTRAAFDPANDFDIAPDVYGIIVGVEFGLDRDFGKVTARTACSPGKNDIFHRAAAQGFGTPLPHHPADCFKQI